MESLLKRIVASFSLFMCVFGVPAALVLMTPETSVAQETSPTEPPTPSPSPGPAAPAPRVSDPNPATSAQPAVVPSPTAAAAAVADQVTIVTVDELKKRVDASTDLMEEQKKALNDLLEQARGDLTQATELANNFKAWQQQAGAIEATRQKAQASLDAVLRERPQNFLEFDTLPKLEQALASKQQDLVHAQSELAQTEKLLNDRTLRQKTIKDRLAALPGELEANTAELTRLAASEDQSLPNYVRRFRFLAQRKRLENESPALQAQSALVSAQEAANLIQLARNEWTARVSRIKDEVSVLQREVLRMRSKDAKDRAEVAKTDAEFAENEFIKKIFEENVAIVEKEIEFREKEKRLKDEITEAESTTSWITEKHKDLASRQGKIGSNKSFGIRLRNERRLLPDLRSYRDQIAERAQVSQEAQLELIDISSQLNQTPHLDNRVNLALQQILPEGEGADLSDDKRYEYSLINWDVRRAYEQQQKFLTELQNANDSYVSALDTLDAQQDRLIHATEAFQKFIVENILWVPTSNVLKIQEILSDRISLEQLFSTQAWTELGYEFQQDALANPMTYVAATLVWLVLLLTQRRQRKIIQALGQKASSRLNTTMQPTWEAIFWTVVKSLILPLPFFFLSIRGKGLSSGTVLLSGYVLTIAIWVFWLELVRNTCRDRGLGVAHFQWPERANKVVTIQLSSLTLLATPPIMMAIVMLARTEDQESRPLQRACTVAFFLLLSYALHRLTSRKTGILREWNELHPGSWSAMLSPVWHLVAVSLPLFLAGLNIAGYTYAAGQLSVRLAQTLMVVFGALVAKAVFVRWLTLRQRRLAIEHAREVRAALADAKTEDDAPQATKLEAQEARTNLVEVSMQSKRLLNTTVSAIALVWIWFIWIDVLPALQRLDQYPIPLLGLSLAKVLAAGLVAILFATAARNIPGLLEMVLLERLPLDRSVRYAIGSLTRYAIVVLGIYVFWKSVGGNWDSLQWLVAALTFGLGFGLQEIFANFVSGLIILFEQPVRVGDVVTIDAVTGSVSKIRIRSTTIVDWDRKEYIVPNKEFITGKLLNWTLSDTTNRIVLNVGVALDSDPIQVREVLMKIVRTQPHLLADPPPVVIFDGFDQGTMRFVIRVFLPNMDNRAETIHQIHVRIVKEFATAGIVIPFPQRDLHIRTSTPFSLQESGPFTSRVNPSNEENRNTNGTLKESVAHDETRV